MNIARRVRNKIRQKLSQRASKSVPDEPNVTTTDLSSDNDNLNIDYSWTKASNFKTDAKLSGSSVVKIWFESVDEVGVRFTLDLGTGVMSERENWDSSIQMPGESALDPEPLSVWGIDSNDGRFNIIMHVADFDSLYVDGKPMPVSDHQEVSALLKILTNVVVRDIWISE